MNSSCVVVSTFEEVVHEPKKVHVGKQEPAHDALGEDKLRSKWKQQPKDLVNSRAHIRKFGAAHTYRRERVFDGSS